MRQFSFILIVVLAALAPGFAGADVVDDISGAIEKFADDDFEVRLEALEVVVGTGRSATVQLVKALDSPKALVRRYACTALGGTADPEAKPALEKKLKEDKSTAVRAAAAAALAAYKSEALDALREAAAEDTAPYVRKSAAIAIASVRSKAAIDLLVWLLKSPEDGVKQIAVDNLRDITLQHFSIDYEVWKKWWLDNRDDFRLTMQAYPYYPLEEEE